MDQNFYPWSSIANRRRVCLLIRLLLLDIPEQSPLLCVNASMTAGTPSTMMLTAVYGFDLFAYY